MLTLQLLLAALVACALGLKFDIAAHPASESGHKERCIRNFVGKGQLVLVTVTASGSKGDGQTLNMRIGDGVGNEYSRPKDVSGENRYAFTALADSNFDVCFDNVLTTSNTHMGQMSKSIELDIDIGADAKDWSGIQAEEKLKPVEADLKRISEVANEIVNEMDYLRQREVKLRDTNESTNERVKWFALGSMGMLVALGVWQVLYLRAYFRSKHLI